MDQDTIISIVVSSILVLVSTYSLFERKLSFFIKSCSAIVIAIVLSANIYAAIKMHSEFPYIPSVFYHDVSYEFPKLSEKMAAEIKLRDERDNLAINLVLNIVPIVLLVLSLLVTGLSFVKKGLAYWKKLVICAPMLIICILFGFTFKINFLSTVYMITNKHF